jgi:dolichol-phosphate mannosyltransferase
LSALAADVDFEFVIVNDGSTDVSWEVLQKLHAKEPQRFTLIKLTRNFGQLPALLAGYSHAVGDCVISMSADMQDPPELVSKMVSAWLDGNKLVVANRLARSDGRVTNFFSNLAWSLLRRYVFPTIPKGGFDFFLMDKEIRDYYVSSPEQHIFMQGRLLYYGITPFVIPYERQRRIHGKSQTTTAKRIKYLIDGIAGYSYIPLRMVSVIGVFVFFLSIFAALIIAWQVIVKGSVVPGWPSIMVAILFLSGLQMLAFGVVGEYLWRNIEETRKRPHYIIDKKIISQND